jgi:Dolichyl-phosphate-mannose-protein mannosyltransferase
VQASINLFGPFYFYLLAIPYGLSANPVVGIAFLNLLNLCSIYLTYRLGTEMFGPPVGLIAAALYAVFPMTVLSGKALWNPGFLPFFVTLFLWTLWRFLIDRRPWMLALVLFLLGVLLQIHVSGAIFVLLLPIVFLLYRPPLRVAPLLGGLLGVALLFAPYLRFEVQHGFPDARQLLTWTGKAPTAFFWDLAGRGFWRPFLLPERFMGALPEGSTPILFSMVQRLELGLVVLGLLVLGTRVITAEDRRPYGLLALWYAFPFMTVPLSRISPWYYFDILYPAPFLAIGLLTQIAAHSCPTGLARWPNWHWSRLALAGVIGGLMVVQVSFLWSFERAVSRSGVFPLVPEILLNHPNYFHPEWPTGIDSASMGIDSANMPLRFKWGLAKRLWREFGADHVILERQAHGSMYELFREDKGFLLSHMSRPKPPKTVDAALHYLLVRNDFRDRAEAGREVVFAPYRIIAYHPMMRYESWKWSASPEPGWWGTGFDDSAWSPVALPARSVPDPSRHDTIPYAEWPRESLAFRGWLEVPAVGQPVWLVLNIREPYSSAHTIGALHLNGQPIELARTVWSNAFNSRNFEVQAEITSALHQGSNLIAFEIKGEGGSFNLDVYEWQVALQPPER